MTLRRPSWPLLCAGLWSLLVGAAYAHHSQSEFDFRQIVDVEGTVTELRWRSPHARLYVDVVNDEGEVENWNFELPSPTTLMRRGWTRKSLVPGDRVTVNAARAKNFPTIAYARTIRDAEGKALFTGITEIYEPPPVGESGESGGSAGRAGSAGSAGNAGSTGSTGNIGSTGSAE